jgi:patatin-like phospholipase/acyl hydrolase
MKLDSTTVSLHGFKQKNNLAIPFSIKMAKKKDRKLYSSTTKSWMLKQITNKIVHFSN